MKNKKSTPVGEYMARGGLQGVAQQQLMDGLLHAKTDPNHPLYEVAKAFQNNDQDLAGRLLFNILVASLDDQDSPLQLPAFVFVKLQAMGLALKEEMDNIRAGKDTIQSVRDLALMQVQREEDEEKWLQPKLDSQKKATQSNRKTTKERHRVIVEAIQYVKLNIKPSLINNDSEIARKVHAHLIKSQKEDKYLIDLFPKIPEPRTIRKIIAKHT